VAVMDMHWDLGNSKPAYVRLHETHEDEGVSADNQTSEIKLKQSVNSECAIRVGKFRKLDLQQPASRHVGHLAEPPAVPGIIAAPSLNISRPYDQIVAFIQLLQQHGNLSWVMSMITVHCNQYVIAVVQCIMPR